MILKVMWSKSKIAYVVKRVRLQTQMCMSRSLDRRTSVRLASGSVRHPHRRRMRKIEMNRRISFNMIYMRRQQLERKTTHRPGNSNLFAKYWLRQCHFFAIRMDSVGPTVANSMECYLQTDNLHSFQQTPHRLQPLSYSRYWRVNRY